MKVNTTRRNAFAGLALAAILGTTGCSYINPQATTFEYAPSDGTQTTVYADEDTHLGGFVEFVNIGVVTPDANDSGRVFGTIHNKSDGSEDVELEINNNTLEFSLDAGEALMLEEEDVVLDSVGTEPGGLAPATATAFGNSVEFQVSILPPRLEEYREFYPGDVDVEEQREHLYDFQGQYHRDE